jgi:hypothetical protein
MLWDIKGEHAYEDMLQYISMSGPLNLRLVAPGKWHSLSKVSKKDQNLQNLDLKFLDEFYIPSNKELGQYIDKLYYPVHDDAFKKSITVIDPIKTFKPNFPANHSIKICIQGKAYAGKKT